MKTANSYLSETEKVLIDTVTKNVNNDNFTPRREHIRALLRKIKLLESLLNEVKGEK